MAGLAGTLPVTMSDPANLTIVQGDTFPYRFTYYAGEPGVAAPVNLTGATAKMQVRASATGPVLLELSTDNGKIVLGGAAGTIDLLLSAAETAAIEWVQAVYDLAITFADSSVRKPIRGSVTVVKAITR